MSQLTRYEKHKVIDYSDTMAQVQKCAQLATKVAQVRKDLASNISTRTRKEQNMKKQERKEAEKAKEKKMRSLATSQGEVAAQAHANQDSRQTSWQIWTMDLASIGWSKFPVWNIDAPGAAFVPNWSVQLPCCRPMLQLSFFCFGL